MNLLRGTVLAPRPQWWYCPGCWATSVTTEARPHTQYHHCAALAGVMAPMIPAGVRAKIEAVEREDYIGREVGVTRDENGKAIMAVKTTRDDGEDCAIFAPVATAGVDS